VRFLLLNQTFPPDPAASGQYLADVACALAGAGHEVTVVTSRRGYADPAARYRAQEGWRGLRIIRVPSTGLGKSARWRRGIDSLSFLAAAAWITFRGPRPDVVLALTSPPLVACVGALAAHRRRSAFCYWVMDLNPDEAIAAGWLRPGSRTARVLESLSRRTLKAAQSVIVLDRFMQGRLAAKGVTKARVIPLWPQTDRVGFDARAALAFRSRHDLARRFIVLYAGNHSPVHPLDTLLLAAERLAAEPELTFCFIGGGSEFSKVQRLAERLNRRASDRRIVCLGYLPATEFSAALSAANAHVVILGDSMVGLVHPCKVYNFLGMPAPVLYIGPEPSPITDLWLSSCQDPSLSGEERAGSTSGMIPARAATVGIESRPPLVRFGHGEAEPLAEQIRSLRGAYARDPSSPCPEPTTPVLDRVGLSRLVSTLVSAAMGNREDLDPITRIAEERD
jgi:glycosyltransferase involved in cell wall biosynthesis